ncbi:MAG: patatin-like phospholipase family protein [Alphaproteobacteria bacterium]
MNGGKTLKTTQGAKPSIFLALQGGGSHGAFTAGVIRALQENGILENVKGISGVSAGAFNAAPLSYALNNGTPEKAPSLLKKAWDGVAHSGKSTVLINQMSRGVSQFFPMLVQGARYPNLPQSHVEQMGSFISLAQAFGAQTQSGDIKARMHEAVPDWDVIRTGDIETVIGATRVEKKGVISLMSRALFSNKQLSPDVIAASATLIGTHQIGKHDYVDGGFTSNPPLDAFYEGEYTDVIAIMLSKRPKYGLIPLKQDAQITGQKFLHDEVYNELAWASLKSGKNVHVIEMQHEPHWDETSKMNAEPQWIEELMERGYQAGLDWVAKHKAALGKETTFKPTISAGQQLLMDKPACAVA